MDWDPKSNGDNQAIRTSFFFDDINDYSRTPPSSSFFHLHSPHYIPLEEEEETIFCDLFQPPHLFSDDRAADHDHSSMEKCRNNNGQIGKKDGQSNAPTEPKSRKKCCKKDRHSKINTAQGPRDRRMRLSLDVAKKFFGLQDLLGFDKASKTVDWLITESKAAIQQLLPHQNYSLSNSASSTSECEVPFGIDDEKNKAKCCYSSSSSKEKAKIARVRKSADLHHPIARETRERARARARERTVEKRYDKLGGGAQYPNFATVFDQGVNRLGAFEENQFQVPTMDQIEQPSSSSHFQNPSLMTDHWGSSYNLVNNYQHPSGLSSEVIMDVDHTPLLNTGF